MLESELKSTSSRCRFVDSTLLYDPLGTVRFEIPLITTTGLTGESLRCTGGSGGTSAAREAVTVARESAMKGGGGGGDRPDGGKRGLLGGGGGALAVSERPESPGHALKDMRKDIEDKPRGSCSSSSSEPEPRGPSHQRGESSFSLTRMSSSVPSLLPFPERWHPVPMST